jgi:2-aminophenol/2-amino-5-chlorophenol 1,6-dioxygenase alpha subunit
MPVVSAFLVPGNPLPRLKPEVPKLAAFVKALKSAGESLARSRPDAVLLYSTQWIAVLDELWLVRRRSTGVHVDENWYEFGDLPFDLYSDADLAAGCVRACPKIGINARGVDYDGFPIDSGTISASALLGIGGDDRPLVVAANNVYHDAATTEKLAAAAVACADESGKRIAVVGVGGLSGSCIRTEIPLDADHIENERDDRWNRRVLELMESGKVAELRQALPDYAREARVDMGFKHFHWILGALQGGFSRARVHGYGPLYGTGGAVVEFAA